MNLFYLAQQKKDIVTFLREKEVLVDGDKGCPESVFPK